MAQDQQTYRRAAHAALIGLGVQLVLAVTLALMGAYAGSPAIHAATWHFFGGLPIWAILWVLYHQHQLERVEALEAEQFAQSDERAAALFDEAGEQLHIARRRLENLNKWWLPIVSVGLATYLLAVGGVLLYLNYSSLVTPAGLRSARAIAERGAANVGVLTIVLISLGFVAFLVARYVAGMTKMREWTLLRGGASYLMGGVVLSVLLAIGAGMVWAGNLDVLAVLALVIPGLMVLLGIEMLLGFLFGLYRPRRPGEIQRPAFDSRTLGLLTRPESLGKIVNEAINYQFGFEISKSWFYRLLSRAVTPLILVGVLVLVGLTSLVIVAPHQQAVVTTFGQYSHVADSGLSLKWPWPISRAEKYSVYRVHELVIGSDVEVQPGVPILWTNQHTDGNEQYVLTAASRFGSEAEAGTENVGVELAGARVVLKYRVSDLAAYVQNYAQPEDYLERLASRRVYRFFASNTIDHLMTTGRRPAGEALKQQIMADVQALPRPLGLEVVFAAIENIHPPQAEEVAMKFHEMVDARQEREAAIQRAQTQAIRTLAEVAGSRERALAISEAITRSVQLRQQLQEAQRQGRLSAEEAEAREQALARQDAEIEQLLDAAGGRAAEMILEARAERWQRALGDRGRALTLAAQYPAYQQVPEYFQRRLFLQALSDGLQNQRKTVIVGQPEGLKDIRLNLESDTANLGGIFGE